MLNAIQGVKLYAHCYTWSEALSSIIHNTCSIIKISSVMTALMYSLLEIIIDSSIEVRVWYQNPIEKEVPIHTFSMRKSDYLIIKVLIRT